MTVRGTLVGRLEHTIDGLEIGEEGFAVPWALSFEERRDGRCDAYLNVKFSIHKIPGGTVQLYVKRTGHGKEDFEVDLETVGDYKYSIGKVSYDGADGKLSVPDSIVCVGQVDMF